MCSQTPTSEEEWRKIARRFEDRWQFLHCLGALDGRHCPIIKPTFSATEFYNYKQFFSVVLLALVDADYNFLYINVGAQGTASDGGVFAACSLKKDLDAGKLHLPPLQPLPGGTKPMPHVIVADDAFALSQNVMKPYPGVHEETSPEIIFNQRMSRARTRVEQVFGIVSSRFRVLRKPMHLNEETATIVILTACYLHNFIRKHLPDDDDPLLQEVLRSKSFLLLLLLCLMMTYNNSLNVNAARYETNFYMLQTQKGTDNKSQLGTPRRQTICKVSFHCGITQDELEKKLLSFEMNFAAFSLRQKVSFPGLLFLDYNSYNYS